MQLGWIYRLFLQKREKMFVSSTVYFLNHKHLLSPKWANHQFGTQSAPLNNNWMLIFCEGKESNFKFIFIVENRFAKIASVYGKGRTAVFGL